MDYSGILQALKEASLFDLYRLRAAIDHMLDQPERLDAIRNRLKPGQTITYFDETENRLIEARVIRLKRTRLLVENRHDGQQWNIPFYYVNLDRVDTDIKPISPEVGLDRSRLKVGDKVGFRDRQNNDLYGQVIRLNRKTATIQTENSGKWRVAYSFLFPIIDGRLGGRPGLIEGEVIDRE